MAAGIRDVRAAKQCQATQNARGADIVDDPGVLDITSPQASVTS
jgi:hypothetical protein